MRTVVELPAFTRQAKAAGMTDAEYRAAVDFIAANPLAGDLMPGTGGARKVRIAGRGKGKSGGYRVVTYFGGHDIPVFLLSVISKGERANLSQAERNELAAILPRIAAAYLAGVKDAVRSQRRPRKEQT